MDGEPGGVVLYAVHETRDADLEVRTVYAPTDARGTVDIMSLDFANARILCPGDLATMDTS
jgi:hypothetical protein